MKQQNRVVTINKGRERSHVMKKQHGFGIIVALALALGLIATPAWADDFKITNSSGGTVSFGCSSASGTWTVNNGSSLTFACSSGTFSAKSVDSTSSYTVNDACLSTQRHHTTASAGTNAGELSLAHTCEALN